MTNLVGTTYTFRSPGALRVHLAQCRAAPPGTRLHLPAGAMRSQPGHWSHRGKRVATRARVSSVWLGGHGSYRTGGSRKRRTPSLYCRRGSWIA